MPWPCWTMETHWTVAPLQQGLSQEGCGSCSSEASQVIIVIIETFLLLGADQGHCYAWEAVCELEPVSLLDGCGWSLGRHLCED